MKKFVKYILIQIVVLLAIASSHAQVIDVQLLELPSPDHSLTFDGLTDKLVATVRNTSSQSLSVNFRLIMTGPESLTIQSDRVFDDDIDLDGGEVIQFRGNDWEDIFESINLNDLSLEARNTLEVNQAFRAGLYEICLIAYNPNTGVELSNGAPLDCVTIESVNGDAPDIITPMADEEIAIDHAPLHITWMHTSIAAGSVEYELKIADVTENPGMTDAELFSLGVVEFQDEGIMGLTYILEEEDIDWIAGHEYVIRVSATDGSISFENAGHSQPVRFRIASEEEEDVEAMDVVTHYPMAHDTIPFLTFPVVVEFSPQSPTINRMDFSTVFNGDTPVTGDLRWNDSIDDGGALEYLQEHGFPGAIWDQAVLQPVLDVQSPMVERAGQYNWFSVVTLHENFTAQDPITTPTQNFVVGMPKPVHQSPAHNATVPAGEIDFQWLSGGRQNKIIPDYKLYHIDRAGTEVASLGDVHEHWVLQVFSANDTDTTGLVKQYDGRLDAGSEQLFDSVTRELNPTLLNEKLYTDLNHSFTIIEEGTYWWRMAWLRNPDMSDADLENLVEAEVYHASSLRPFNIGSTGIVTTETEEETDCTSICVIGTPNSTGATALSVGHKTKIGKFELEVKTITSESSGKYTGTGIVTVPFLNDLKVRVEFTEIKANGENKIFTGTVNVEKDNSFPTRGIVRKGLNLLDVNETIGQAIDDYFADTGRIIGTMVGEEISLPVGWDFEVDGNRIRMAIMDIDFNLTSAEMKAVALVDIPIISDSPEDFKRVISLGARDLCINPGGIGSNGRFYVPEDLEFNPEDENVFAIKGLTEVGGTSEREESDYTYLMWDCDGFRKLQIALQIKFSRETIVPEDEDGQPAAEGNVTASAIFNLNRTEGFNFLANVTFNSPFQIPKENANGWGFVASNVWLDLSTVANPEGIVFPEGYVFGTEDGRLPNTWKGFWIQKLAIKAPHFIESAGGTRKTTNVSVNNFIIDPKVSFSFRIENLIPLSDDAVVDGTHISLDTVFFDVMQNNFLKAGFNGRIALPIAEDKPSQMFQYQVMLDNAMARDDEVEEGEEPERRLGLVLSARPAADTVHIIAKGFMMKGAIAKSSFIELGYRGEVYTKFELNGRFGISTGNDEHGADRSFSLNMPSIEIEGLKFDSSKETDKFECIGCFHTGLASPQKTMSGFPLSLESINLGMIDGKLALSIEPKITFMGGNDGFSPSAVINIFPNLRKEEGKWKFSIDDANVSKISLNDIELGGLKISGSLEFYNVDGTKGTRGNLAVELPAGIAGNLSADFGAYKNPEATNAAFDTEDWYSYWYVDGTIMFGDSGMPFGAVNLYGLGGGASYHMTQSELPDGEGLSRRVGETSGALDSERSEGEEITDVTDSGSSYLPRFDTGLGLKFRALFGSPGGGDAYNFDVTLKAEFNVHGGLSTLGFKGHARVMPDPDHKFDDPLAPIQAYISINMDRIDIPEELLISGNFIISLNFGGFIKGSQTGLLIDPGADYDGPSTNIFVEAAFMSDQGSGDWYYVMGKPAENERGGVTVTLFGKDVLAVKGYFLAGNALEKLGITLGMPAPVKLFREIQATASGGDIYPGLEGVEDQLTLADDRIVHGMTIGNNVKGFQFGMSMSLNTDRVSFFPFYFDLKMALGFDVLTKYLETCNGYDEDEFTQVYNPGWYSEGQFYAGIDAEFGLFVDFWFIQEEFTIFHGAAALIMQGNLPDPSGFRGNGDIYFEVLGGLVEGNYHFDFDFGEKCVAPATPLSNILDGIEIIQDLKPAGGRNNSVFSVPQAAFAIAIEKELVIPVSDGEIVIIKPFIKEWTLKRKDNGEVVKCDPWKMANNNTQANLPRASMLNGETEYSQYLRVEAVKKSNMDGVFEKIYIDDIEDEGVWHEDSTVNFRTGASPDVVDKDNILFTYPLDNQKHFLKGETEGGKGYLVLNMAQSQDGKVFDKRDESGELGNKDFIARFIKIDGTNDNFETPLELGSSEGKVIKFDVSDVENDQTYLVQLLSRKRQTSEPMVNVEVANNSALGPLRESLANRFSNQLGNNYYTATYKGAQKRKLPENLTFNAGEKILYEYYFKTSDYNTFKEKVSGVDWQGTLAAATDLRDEYVSFSAEWDEYPERYDRYGYANPNGKMTVPRLLNITVNVDGLDGSYDYSAYPLNNYFKYRHITNFSTPSFTIASKFKQWGLSNIIANVNETYNEGVDFADNSKMDPPLSKREVSNSFTTSGRNTVKNFGGPTSQVDIGRGSYPSASTLAGLATGGATTSAPVASSGYLFVGMFDPSIAIMIADASTPKIRINHKVPAMGNRYLSATKENIAAIFFKPIDIWYAKPGEYNFGGYNRPQNGHCLEMVQKNYVDQYSSKYTEKQLRKYIVNKPTSMLFLYEFDRELYSKTLKLLYDTKVGYPRYGKSNRLRPVSFIMDYKYPSSRWSEGSANMGTTENSHVRIQKTFN